MGKSIGSQSTVYGQWGQSNRTEKHGGSMPTSPNFLSPAFPKPQTTFFTHDYSRQILNLHSALMEHFQTLGAKTSNMTNPNKYTMKIKTASDLKYAVDQSGNEHHFFTRSTMRFFGDTMKNYSVRQPVTVVTNMGETMKAYELVRRHPVGRDRLTESAWFHAKTFKRVFPTTQKAA